MMKLQAILIKYNAKICFALICVKIHIMALEFKLISMISLGEFPGCTYLDNILCLHKLKLDIKIENSVYYRFL